MCEHFEWICLPSAKFWGKFYVSLITDSFCLYLTIPNFEILSMFSSAVVILVITKIQEILSSTVSEYYSQHTCINLKLSIVW